MPNKSNGYRTLGGLDPLAIVNTPPTKQSTRPSENYSGVNVGLLEQARLANNNFGVSQEFVQNDLAQRKATEQNRGFEFGIGEDMRQVQNLGGTPRFVDTALGGQYRSNLASGGQADLKSLVDQETASRLGDIGLQGTYEQNMYKGYKYSPTTGKYEYYDNTPSMLETVAPALIKAGVLGVATGGLGGALSSGLGVSTGIGKALASTGLNALFGEDLNLENTVKNLASAYGMEKLSEFSDVLSTGSEFVDDILKNTVGSIAKGEDPKKAVLTSILKQGAQSAADFFDLGDTEDSLLAGLSDFDKEYLQPIKNAVEDSLGIDFSEAFDAVKGDVDELLAVIPEPVKDLIEGYAKYKLGETTGAFSGGLSQGTQGQSLADASTLSNPLLYVNDSELTNYESLDNNLLQKMQFNA